jgi:tetratricopeptide (TPR) repeat protein
MKINFVSPRVLFAAILLPSAVVVRAQPGNSNTPAPGAPPQAPDYSERIDAAFDRQAKEPNVDTKKIVSLTTGFLKDREPEMTAEEYALYEKIAVMLSSQPSFALKLLEAMMNDKQKPSPAFEFILGNAYYADGQNEKARASYEHAVQRFPSFLRAWNNLGVVYYSTERYAEAIPCFSKSVTLGDRDPTTFGLLGYCLERMGNVVPAEMSYIQALAGDPNSLNWMEGLLRIYVEGRQFGRAESLVKNLIKAHPTEARYWLTYANVMVAQNRKLEAITLLEVATGTGLAGNDELSLLADLYAEQHLVSEAVAVYQKLTAAHVEVGERKLVRLAQVLISNRKFSEAEKVLAPLGATISRDGRLEYLQTRADFWAAQKQWPEARKDLEELLALAPLNGRALLALGRAYAATNELPRATLAFESAFRVPDSAYRASLELANIELKNRQYQKSVDYLEKALSIEKTDQVQDYLAQVRTLLETK